MSDTRPAWLKNAWEKPPDVSLTHTPGERYSGLWKIIGNLPRLMWPQQKAKEAMGHRYWIAARCAISRQPAERHGMFAALMKMTKPDIAALRRACEGWGLPVYAATTRIPGRNRITARMPSTVTIPNARPWTIRKAGSDCVGARARMNGIFWKACTIETNTLR